MKAPIPSLELVPRVRNGEVPAIARLLTRAEAGDAEVFPALAALYKQAGQAHVVGITGTPGGGKSTLVCSLAKILREQVRSLAVIAVDPSSPYSGGSILGDRIRMTELARDPKVFIRSMATHGAVGGLAQSTLDAVDILDVAGFEIIIIETVGVGQDEVEIAKTADTTIVVSPPGLGDEIQALKAGTLEIADIHVVSKFDKSEASRTIADLKQMLTHGHAAGRSAGWLPMVLGVSSYSSEGVADLAKAILSHRHHLSQHDHRQRFLEKIDFRLRRIAESLARRRLGAFIEANGSRWADSLVTRETDPYRLAEVVLAQAFQTGTTK